MELSGLVDVPQICGEILSDLVERTFEISNFRRKYLAQGEIRETRNLSKYVGDYFDFMRSLMKPKDSRISNREIDEQALQSRVKEEIQKQRGNQLLPSFRVERKQNSVERKSRNSSKHKIRQGLTPVKSNPRSQNSSRHHSKKKPKKIKKRKNRYIKFRKSSHTKFFCIDDCTESHRIQSDNWARCMLTTTKPQILPPVKFFNSTYALDFHSRNNISFIISRMGGGWISYALCVRVWAE